MLFRGPASLVKIKMRLHEGAGCVDLNDPNPESVDANAARTSELADKTSELLSRLKTQQSLSRRSCS